MLKLIKKVVTQYPITRGMITYCTLYPSSNCVQQLLNPEKEKVDLKEVARFAIFGGLVTAPTVYCWMKFINVAIKGNTLKHAITKAIFEQFTWAPFAYTQFFVGMSAFEGHPWNECVEELTTKFWPTWKTGVCFWPIIQTVNFWLIPEKNRVPFVSFCSFLWIIYLSYMHHINYEK